MKKQSNVTKEKKRDIRKLELNKENIDSYSSKFVQEEYDRRVLSNEEGRIILSDLNFFWSHREIEKIIAMWENGVSFTHIARVYTKKNNWSTRRKEEEVFLLLLDLSRQGKIKKRSGFMWGSE